MHRFRKCIRIEPLSYFKRGNMTSIGAPIEDMPHPKGLPLIGTKLEFFAAGGGSM